MSERKQLVLNLAANFIYLLINYAITFFLTSFVVNRINAEAYGFISLCNKVVDYATLITVALNSVAGRFITIEMHKGNVNKANQYFSSTLAADAIICMGLLLVFLPIAYRIEYIFHIPSGLVNDVRVLFLIIVTNLFVTVIGTVYTVATFITNKLYLSSIANMLGNVVRAAILIVFMRFFSPNIVYVGIATSISSALILALNILYTRKLCPELHIKQQDISLKATKELFFSGIWNSISKLAQILSDGIDLVISNIWISAYAMGQLSIAYTIPTIVAAFLVMVINLFSPKLTEYYAKGDMERILSELRLNMKMTAFFGNVIFFGLVTTGMQFFRLWVPESNILMVYKLMLFATISLLVSGIVSPLSNVFLLTNKLKVNSIIWLCVSIVDLILVILLVNTTTLGVYAVAGVSKIVGALVNLVFLPIYASKCLKTKPAAFYRLICHYFVTTACVGTLMILISRILGESNSWFHFIVKAMVLAAAGFSVNYFVFLNKAERSYFFSIIKKKLFGRLHNN